MNLCVREWRYGRTARTGFFMAKTMPYRQHGVNSGFAVPSISAVSHCILASCRRGGMADALDSKSSDRKIVWVQPPPPALPFFSSELAFFRGKIAVWREFSCVDRFLSHNMALFCTDKNRTPTGHLIPIAK